MGPFASEWLGHVHGGGGVSEFVAEGQAHRMGQVEAALCTSCGQVTSVRARHDFFVGESGLFASKHQGHRRWRVVGGRAPRQWSTCVGAQEGRAHASCTSGEGHGVACALQSLLEVFVHLHHGHGTCVSRHLHEASFVSVSTPRTHQAQVFAFEGVAGPCGCRHVLGRAWRHQDGAHVPQHRSRTRRRRRHGHAVVAFVRSTLSWWRSNPKQGIGRGRTGRKGPPPNQDRSNGRKWRRGERTTEGAVELEVDGQR
eukprot:scaffold24_cov341-Pavlova_lutheri.AAC.33